MERIETFEAFFEERKQTRACICGSTSAMRIPAEDRYGLLVEPVICLTCGHVYARAGLVDQDLVQFYQQHYRNLYSGKGALKTEDIKDQKVERAHRKIFTPLAPHLSGRDQPLVIEVGASAGWNLIPFQQAGMDTIGFDFDVDHIKFGSEDFGLDLRPLGDDGRPVTPPERPADALIMNHMLEHAPDPRATILAAMDLLGPDGIVYVGLPFLESLDSGWYGHFHVAHIHYFTVDRFTQLAKTCGLELLDDCGELQALIFRRTGAAPADAKPSWGVPRSLRVVAGHYWSERLKPALLSRLGQSPN